MPSLSSSSSSFTITINNITSSSTILQKSRTKKSIIMRFFITSLLAVLSFLGAAQPTEEVDIGAAKAAAAPTVTGYSSLGLLATRPGSPIHLQPINANGLSFWIGKPTTSYCPLTPQSSCPKGEKTIVYIYVDTYRDGITDTSVALGKFPCFSILLLSPPRSSSLPFC